MEEFEDIFLTDLLPGLPPIRGIEHWIDLIHGASLPDKAANQGNPKETMELQRQVDESIARGYVRENVILYSIPAPLVPKKDGSFRMCVEVKP